MPREFEFALTDEFDIAVEEDESGGMYVERSTATRVAWMVFGLFVVAASAWFAVGYDGSEGPLLTVVTPSVIALFALAGVVAEPVFGSERSAVVESNGGYFLEMMTASRWYVAAASVAVLMTGVSMFLAVRAPGVVQTRGRRSGMVSLAESLPFGEFVVLLAAGLLALWLLQRVRRGRMRIEPKRG